MRQVTGYEAEVDVHTRSRHRVRCSAEASDWPRARDGNDAALVIAPMHQVSRVDYGAGVIHGRRTALLLAALLLAYAAALLPASASAAPHWCECVEYVKNSFGLRGAAGNAKDMGPFLAARGFRRSATPKVGAVVILQPAFYRTGSGAVYGHAGIIESLAAAGTHAWFIGVRGANQLGKQFTSASCGNVTFRSLGPIANGSPLATYWLPPAH